MLYDVGGSKIFFIKDNENYSLEITTDGKIYSGNIQDTKIGDFIIDVLNNNSWWKIKVVSYDCYCDLTLKNEETGGYMSYRFGLKQHIFGNMTASNIINAITSDVYSKFDNYVNLIIPSLQKTIIDNLQYTLTNIIESTTNQTIENVYSQKMDNVINQKIDDIINKKINDIFEEKIDDVLNKKINDIVNGKIGDIVKEKDKIICEEKICNLINKKIEEFEKKIFRENMNDVEQHIVELENSINMINTIIEKNNQDVRDEINISEKNNQDFKHEIYDKINISERKIEDKLNIIRENDEKILNVMFNDKAKKWLNSMINDKKNTVTKKINDHFEKIKKDLDERCENIDQTLLVFFKKKSNEISEGYELFKTTMQEEIKNIFEKKDETYKKAQEIEDCFSRIQQHYGTRLNEFINNCEKQSGEQKKIMDCNDILMKKTLNEFASKMLELDNTFKDRDEAKKFMKSVKKWNEKNSSVFMGRDVENNPVCEDVFTEELTMTDRYTDIEISKYIYFSFTRFINLKKIVIYRHFLHLFDFQPLCLDTVTSLTIDYTNMMSNNAIKHTAISLMNIKEITMIGDEIIRNDITLLLNTFNFLECINIEKKNESLFNKDNFEEKNIKLNFL